MKDEQDRFGLCPLHHPTFCEDLSRRGFLELVAAAGAAFGATGHAAAAQPAPPSAPPAKKPPVLKAAYLRHAAAVTRGWPGHGFNNDDACREYSEKLQAMGRELGIEVDLADAMVTDDASVARFIEAAQAERPDALMIAADGHLQPLDPGREIFAALEMPTLVFTPIGGSFTMNTAPIAHKPGFY